MKALRLLVLSVVVLVPALHAVDDLLITEFMALNNATLADEDGAYPDWVELYNAGGNTADLNGWFLTDNADNLTRWQFPATNLPPNRYLVVFCSGKNRRVPGAPLHTSFSLSGGGEYLGLVKPDGLTIVSQFAPAFPGQFTDVSCGLAMTGAVQTLLATGALARVFVPSNDIGVAWRAPGYEDAAWLAATNGAGFDTGTNYLPALRTDLRALMLNRNASVFLRLPFVVTDPASIKELTLRLRYDDGFVAYLNGVEVARSNAPVSLAWNAAAAGNHGVGLPGSLTENFEGAGTNYTLAQYGGTPAPAVQAAGTNSTGRFLRLIHDGNNGNVNGIAFNQTAPGLFERITADFDFRIIDADGAPADGFAFLVIPTSLYGTTGAGANVASVAIEEPNLPGVFAVGFDVYPRADPRNDVSVHWNGAEIQNLTMANANVNLTAGLFHHAAVALQFVAGGARVTITLTPNVNGTPGAPYTPIKNLFVAGLTPYDCRVQFGGRTGGLNMTVDLDNLNVQFTPPGGVVLPEDFNLPAGVDALVAGTNILALHGLNRAAADSDFLLEAVLLGRDVAVVATQPRYFSPATPGAANLTALAGKATAPTFAPPAGVYASNSLRVTLAGGSSSAILRYTLDGSEPTGASLLYSTNGIPISNDTVIRARAFDAGRLDGDVVAANYVLLAGDLTNFTSNLPLVVLDTLGGTMAQDTRIPAYATFIDTKAARVSLLSPPDYQGRLGIEIHGSSSAGFPKHSYRIELDDERGEDRGFNLLGLPKHSDWVLYAPYTDKSFMNDVLAFELHEAMGHYAVRRKFVEVFLRQTPGRLSAGDYAGIYVLLEKIAIDDNRVDIAKLGPDDNTPPSVTGGYILKKDRLDPNDLAFSTISGQALGIEAPKASQITQAQRDYLAAYVNEYESALYGPNWRDPANGYAQYIDVASFVDQHWIVEYPKNIDGYRLSNFMNKDRNGPLRLEPIWDWNLSFGNANYVEGEFTNGWYYPLLGEGDDIWLRKLRSDPDFYQKITDRWAELRGDVLATSNVLARVGRIGALLNEAQARDFARWPRLGVYVWPNPPLYSQPTTYAGILNSLSNWIVGRGLWIDSQFTPAPTLSHPGGPITPGLRLTLAAPLGTIYFTTDGSDPRPSGGGVSPAARLYTAPISITTNAGVIARALNGTAWSGPARAVFVVQPPTLAITEIMYHPLAPPTNSPYAAEDWEYVEIENTGSAALDLAGVRLGGGIQFTFPAGSLVPTGAATSNRFDGEGTAYAASTLGALPGAAATPGGPSGDFLRLLNSGTKTSRNRIAFNQTAGAGYGRVTADFDFRAVTSAAASSNGAPTVQDFDSAGTSYTLTNYSGSGAAVQPADAGSSGSFLRLAPALNNQLATVAFSRTATGAFSTVVARFDFRLTPPSEGNQADGLGFALLNTANFGTSGPGPVLFEEVNLAGSVGVGFDIYNNAGTAQEPNNNHVSVHWNGALIGSPATPSFDLSNGRFHRAQLTLRFAGSNAYATVRLTPDILGTPGATETVFQDFLIAGVAPYEGRVAFGARTGGAVASHDLDSVTVQFLNTGTPAGLSLALLPAAQFGASGVGSTLATYLDSPTITNGFALDLSFHPGNSVNDVALFWNNALAYGVTVSPTGLDLDSGVFHHACLQLDASPAGANATLTLTPNSLGTPGAPVTAVSNLFIPGVGLGDGRVELAGRNGSLTAALDVDNVVASYSAIGPNLLLPGECILVVRNRAAFESRYGTGRRIAGEFTGKLDDGGERLTLTGGVGEPILDFAYDDDWHPITDGLGFSLVLADPAAPPSTWNGPAGWRASSGLGGSPGTPDSAPPAIAPIVVNEALTQSQSPEVDAVELFNPTASAANLGGWFLTDAFFEPRKFRIPEGTVIPAGGFAVFTEDDFNAAGAGFALDSDGDEVWLFSADAAANLTGYVHGFDFGAADEGVSFGRHVNSVGEEHFVAQSLNTLGGANASPQVGPVVISEIMFHPPDAGTNNNGLDEFIELHNPTADAVPLFDTLLPTNTWRLRGAVEFEFPTNLVLPPASFLLVVSFDPVSDPVSLASFRACYGSGNDVPVLGPYRGKLDNSGDSLELQKPVPPRLAVAPYVLVERVAYRDTAPWPDGADGTGASLQRRTMLAYGEDPTNWLAAVPSPGTNGIGGEALQITAQPQSQTVVERDPVTFSVTLSNSATLPIGYRWRRANTTLTNIVQSQTTCSFTIPGARLTDAGSYAVIITNGAGQQAVSAAAILTVLADVDGDRLPDGWEVQHGFSTNNAADGLLDPDGDGMNNRAEYLAGTDPTNALSLLSVDRFAWPPAIDFFAISNRSYTVECRDAVGDGAWRKLADIPARPTNRTETVTDPAPPGNERCYRIRTPMTP